MSNIQKFQLAQGGKNYILTSEIEGDYIKLTCIESAIQNPPIYIGRFSLVQLRQMSKMFNTMTTLYEAQTFLNQSIENQKVSVENQSAIINIILYFQRETESENIETNNYNTQQINYNTEPLVYNTVEQQQEYVQIPVTTTTTETIENNINTYFPESTYTQNQTYETYDTGANYENYQTYENLNIDTNNNINTNYEYNYNNAIEVQQAPVQEQTQVQAQEYTTTTTTNVQTQNLESLTLPLIPNQQIDENKYLLEIEQLKNQIKLLQQENYILKQKTVEKTVITTNNDQSGEILLLKQEIARLKLQIEELLKNKKRLEDLLLEAKKTIEELKLQISRMMEEKTYTESIIRKQQKQVSGGDKQTLMIQDTRLEIIKGDIIVSTSELEFLTRKICQNYNKITLNLIYKATIDSDKASVFHNKCDFASNSLVLVKSTNGKRFGGYTSCSWEGNSIEKKDENAFVFSLDKMQIYDILPGEDAIGCYPKYGPVFLGCQIRIYDEFFKNGGTTFEKGMNYDTQEDFELTGGLKKFDIKEIEVYSVELI